MKKNLLTRCASALLVTGILSTLVAIAADPVAPAPAAPATPPAGGGNQAGGRGGFGGGNQAGGRGGFGGITLDAKQRELFREASDKNTDTLAKLQEKLAAAQKELMTAVLAEKYDEKVVQEKADVVSKIQTEMLMLRSKALSTLAPTLTPEQHESLITTRFGFMMLSGGGFGFGGGQGGPGAGFGGGQGGQAGQGGAAAGGGQGFRNGGGAAGGGQGGQPGAGGAPGGRRRGGQGGQPPAQ